MRPSDSAITVKYRRAGETEARDSTSGAMIAAGGDEGDGGGALAKMTQAPQWRRWISAV